MCNGGLLLVIRACLGILELKMRDCQNEGATKGTGGGVKTSGKGTFVCISSRNCKLSQRQSASKQQRLPCTQEVKAYYKNFEYKFLKVSLVFELYRKTACNTIPSSPSGAARHLTTQTPPPRTPPPFPSPPSSPPS